MALTREDIFRYAKENYGTEPDYPWDDLDAAVLRKPSSKWYALVMGAKRSAVGLDGNDLVDVINLKCTSFVREVLIGEGKAVPAYHMNKRLWITIPLTDKVTMTEVGAAIDESYGLVK